MKRVLKLFVAGVALGVLWFLIGFLARAIWELFKLGWNVL